MPPRKTLVLRLAILQLCKPTYILGVVVAKSGSVKAGMVSLATKKNLFFFILYLLSSIKPPCYRLV